MTGRAKKWVIPTAAIAVVSAMLLFTMARAMPMDQVMAVNGSPVLEEEFLLLLRENTVQYENELRQEYGIPNEQSVRSYFAGEGENYWRLLLRQNVTHFTYLRTEQTLAAKYGVAPEFTYESFLEELDAENRRREEALSKGEPVYGLRSFTPEQYYSYKMSNLRVELLRTLTPEHIAITDEEIDAYYQSIPRFEHIEGETIDYTLYDVTAAQFLPEVQQTELYNQIAAAMDEGTYSTCSAGDSLFFAEHRSFTPTSLRNFIRQSFDAEFLLSLEPGEMTAPFTVGDKSYLAQYNGFHKTDAIPEDEKERFRTQLEESAYQSFIMQTAEKAKVEENQSLLERFANSEDLW